MTEPVKRYFPEEVVGSGDLFVLDSDYYRLEQECERLSNELNNMRISWGLMQSEREAALKQVEGLRDDLRFLAEYITADSAGNPLPNYLAIGRFPVDVARAALSAKPCSR